MRRLWTVTMTACLAAAAAAAPVPAAPGNPSSPTAQTTNSPRRQGAPSVRPTKENLKLVDESLDRAEKLVGDLEGAARAAEKGAGCPPGVAVKDFVSDLKAKRGAKELGGNIPETGGAKRDWQVYHICRALAADDPVQCADADAIPSTGGQFTGAAAARASYRSDCEVTYHEARAVAASIRGGEKSFAVCREELPHLATFRDAAAVVAVCRAWKEDKGGEHAALLAALQAAVTKPMTRDYALGAIGEMTADPAYCPKVTTDYVAVSCSELADFRKAFAAGDASRCRGALCRVHMGATIDACEEYSRSFMKAACTKSYAVAFTTDSRTAFARLADQAEAALSGLDAGAVGTAELEQVGVRFDRVYALRARFDKAAAAYAPGLGKVGPGPSVPRPTKRPP